LLDQPSSQSFEAASLQLKAFELGIGMAEQRFVCGNHEASWRSPSNLYSALVFVAVIDITVDADAASGGGSGARGLESTQRRAAPFVSHPSNDNAADDGDAQLAAVGLGPQSRRSQR
jgi:hypothetical protein